MRASLSLNDELASYVHWVSSTTGDNDAAAIREALRHGRDLQQRTEELKQELRDERERVDELERELERVRREKRLLLEEREEKSELVRYVEQERTAEQLWREAGFATRMKWRLFGMPGEKARAAD